MENVATPSQAGTLDWQEYLFAKDLGGRGVLRIRLHETHVDADCYYLGTRSIDTTLPAVVLINFPTRGTCMALVAPSTISPT